MKRAFYWVIMSAAVFSFVSYVSIYWDESAQLLEARLTLLHQLSFRIMQNASSILFSSKEENISTPLEEEYKMWAENRSLPPSVTPQYCNESVEVMKLSEGLKIPFIPGLKNPCWLESSSKSHNDSAEPDILVRCLPYFIMGGQPKCGTSDFYQRIKLHPDVIAPKRKGLHYWSRLCLDNRQHGSNVSLHSYVDKFHKLATHLGKECNLSTDTLEINPSCSVKITYDVSESTFWDSNMSIKKFKKIIRSEEDGKEVLSNLLKRRHGKHKLLNLFDKGDEDNFGIPDLINLALPDAKLIVFLRDPIERLYSEYKYFKYFYKNPTVEEFDAYVNQSIAQWEECVNQRSTRSCSYYKKFYDKMKLRLHIGMYSTFLKDWLKVFPREQILLMRTEDYGGEPVKSFREIFRFLEIRQLTDEEMKPLLAKFRVNANQKTKIGNMLPRTRQKLEKFYQPFNSELALLWEDKSLLWGNET